MTWRPLVSVIVPAHNRARLVHEAIDSALAQTHDRLEVIVVDDGSTDETAAVVEAYTDPRVHLVQRENGGISAARNTGIDAAGGQVLAFLDSDDRWAPEKLERQLAPMAGEVTLDGTYGFTREFTDDESALPVERDSVTSSPSATIVRRASFERVGPFQTGWRVGEWMEWWARAMDAGLRFAPVASAVTYRRLHDDNQGLREIDGRADYAAILKQVLDRRRAAALSGPEAAAPSDGS